MAKSHRSSDVNIRTRPRIVILGAGFAGANCAQLLERLIGKSEADILLLDPHNYFVFYPLLVEAGVGALEPRHVIVPIRSFITRRTRFRMAEVESIDPRSQTVRYSMMGEDGSRTVGYDHLVVTLGSVTMTPPVPGLAEHGWTMKGLGDAVALRDRAIQLLELANVQEDPEIRRELLRFVVVGGSYTGVEVAGEFLEFMKTLAVQYRNLKPSDCEIVLVDRGERILSALHESLADYAARELKHYGVIIKTKTSVNEIREDRTILSDGEVIHTRTVVWCAGISQNPVTRAMPLPMDARGYLLCDQNLNLQGFGNIWAAGDGAVIPDGKGGSQPPTAQHAVREGDHLARNLARAIKGKPPEPFHFRGLGALVPLGHYRAVAEVLGIRLKGFPAWWLWRTIYLIKMPTLSRKVRVATDWTLDLIFSRNVAQLGMQRARAHGHGAILEMKPKAESRPQSTLPGP
jgi:NADH dehydrogenase